MIEVKNISAVENWELTDYPLQKTIVILNQEQLKEEIILQEEKLQNRIKSLGLFLNLSQLNKALNNQEISAQYLQQAAQIEPRID
jgi:hypothetical protein